ncbi:hypothetical protein AKH00_09150 [Microbacterium sp. GCS4]|nr:hypothetical protein AKH00_09150 [Microbacterium sp. GCS4]
MDMGEGFFVGLLLLPFGFGLFLGGIALLHGLSAGGESLMRFLYRRVRDRSRRRRERAYVRKHQRDLDRLV